MAAKAAERFGRIDILMNNAAIFYGLDTQDPSLAYFNRILSVNLTGVWLCTRAVEPLHEAPAQRQDHQPIVDRGVHGQRRRRSTPATPTSRRRRSTTASPRWA